MCVFYSRQESDWFRLLICFSPQTPQHTPSHHPISRLMTMPQKLIFCCRYLTKPDIPTETLSAIVCCIIAVILKKKKKNAKCHLIKQLINSSDLPTSFQASCIKIKDMKCRIDHIFSQQMSFDNVIPLCTTRVCSKDVAS